MLQLFKKKNKEKLPARLRGNSCLNCNVTLAGEESFCPECGQRNNVNQLNFKLVLDEFFGDIFSYDSRLWGTVIPLILKPGKVAYEFVSGKRKYFVNPFRTYLTVSLIFFLTFGLLKTINELSDNGSNNFKTNIITIGDTKIDSLKVKQKDSIAKAAIEKAQKKVPINIDSTLQANNIVLDSLSNYNTNLDSLKKKASEQSPFIKKVTAFYNNYKENKDQPIAQALDSLAYANNFWNRFYYSRAQRSYDMWEDKGESFNEQLFSSLSFTIFLFLPVFALFLKLIYIRRKYTYMEHLVFVFYTQTVFFLLFLLFLIVSFIAKDSTGSIVFIALLLFTIYLLLAMKNFYKQGWFKTFFKFLLANFSFLIVSTIGLSILTLVSFIFY